ncbi:MULTISPECIES: septum formation family protein [unclassified Frankia]
MVTFLAIIVGMITITVVALRQTANRTSPTAARLAPTTSSGSSVAATRQTAVPAATGALTGPPAGFGLRPDLLAALRPGDCLNWTPYPAGSLASVDPVVPVRVSCGEPHIDEVTRMVDLAVLFQRWPGASAIAEVTDERCAGALREFAGAVDSTPHRTAGTIYPSEPSWQHGAHAAVCTVRTGDLRPRSGPSRVPGAVAAPEFPRGRPNIR